MEKLRVSGNGRHLETEGGIPFLYLADTAWTLPQRLKWDDVLYYMNRRKVQGFNTLQIVALDPERDVQMRNPAGDRALEDDESVRPNEKYFAYLDWVLDCAEQMGFRVLLLPVWGQLVVGEDWGGKTYPRTITEDNAYEFGRWIGNRYRDRSNIIWCLGGDRQPVHKGTDFRDVWRRMAEGLVKGVTGVDCRYNEANPAWDELLITYHTCYEMETGEYSTMSYWTDEEAWLDLILLQSGHGLNTTNYKVVRREYEREQTMPVLDAEPAYERMPMNWPEHFPLHDDKIVRQRAYWSLLAGSCGHTYGHASVWCMISEKERNPVLNASWYEALEHPGAEQIRVVRHLAESLPFQRWIPAQQILDHEDTCGSDCLGRHRQAAVDREGEFAIIYFTNGGEEKVDLSKLTSPDLLYVWLNPRTGVIEDCLEGLDHSVTRDWGGNVFSAPTQDDDWLLIVVTDEQWLQALGETREWARPLEIEQMSMIWA